MSLDPFYPIFDDADWLERLLPLGIKLVQLRVKDRTEVEVRTQIRRAKELCAEHQAQLVVNDYWQVALEEGCDFVHLGQEDLDTADIPMIQSAGVRLGVSTHDLDELQRVMNFTPDYIALGPIYPTILKKMKWHQQGVEKLTEWKAAIGDIPLVGIGGMSVERAPGVLAAGADIVSVVTDITLNDDPGNRVREWLSATRSAA